MLADALAGRPLAHPDPAMELWHNLPERGGGNSVNAPAMGMPSASFVPGERMMGTGEMVPGGTNDRMMQFANAMTGFVGGTMPSADDLVRLYHGTTAAGYDAIKRSGRINGPAYFGPNRRVAELYAESPEYIVEALVPKKNLRLDFDFPDGRLLTLREARSYTGNRDWSLDDFLRSGQAVGVPRSVRLR